MPGVLWCIVTYPELPGISHVPNASGNVPEFLRKRPVMLGHVAEPSYEQAPLCTHCHNDPRSRPLRRCHQRTECKIASTGYLRIK